MNDTILKFKCNLGFEGSTFCSKHNGLHKPDGKIIARLDYLRGEIEAERISYTEIAELQSLVDYIPDDDVVLREWAGLPEFTS